MNLTNLEQTTTLCIQYHENKSNHSRVHKLKNDLIRIETKRFESETQYNGLYQGHEKKETFGRTED